MEHKLIVDVRVERSDKFRHADYGNFTYRCTCGHIVEVHMTGLDTQIVPVVSIAEKTITP